MNAPNIFLLFHSQISNLITHQITPANQFTRTTLTSAQALKYGVCDSVLPRLVELMVDARNGLLVVAQESVDFAQLPVGGPLARPVVQIVGHNEALLETNLREEENKKKIAWGTNL